MFNPKFFLFLLFSLAIFLSLGVQASSDDWIQLGKCVPEIITPNDNYPNKGEPIVCSYNFSYLTPFHLKWNLAPDEPVIPVPGLSPCSVKHYKESDYPDGRSANSWDGWLNKLLKYLNKSYPFLSVDSNRAELKFRDHAFVEPTMFSILGLKSKISNGDVLEISCFGYSRRYEPISVFSRPVYITKCNLIDDFIPNLNPDKVDVRDPNSPLLYRLDFSTYPVIGQEVLMKALVSVYNKMLLTSNCQPLVFPGGKRCYISNTFPTRGSYRDRIDGDGTHYRGHPEEGQNTCTQTLPGLSPHGAGLALDFICDGTGTPGNENDCGVVDSLISRLRSAGWPGRIIRECTQGEKDATGNTGTSPVVHIDLCG